MPKSRLVIYLRTAPAAAFAGYPTEGGPTRARGQGDLMEARALRVGKAAPGRAANLGVEVVP